MSSNTKRKGNGQAGCLDKVVRMVNGKKAGENDDVDDVIEYEKGVVGIGPCKPNCFQGMANIWAFVISIAPFSIANVALTKYLRSQVSHIEKHFHINSATTGQLLSAETIGFLVAVLPMAHYGKFWNIPRFLAFQGVIAGLVWFSVGFIQFYMPAEMPSSGGNSSVANDNNKYLCDAPNSTKVTEDGSDSYPWVLYYFAGCVFLNGAILAARTPLTVFFIENNVIRKSQTGLVIGVLMSFQVLGYPAAMFLGSFTSNVPVDLEDTDVSPKDPRFIGAWWLGLIIIGSVCAATGLASIIFPKRIVIPKVKSDTVIEITIEPPTPTPTKDKDVAQIKKDFQIRHTPKEENTQTKDVLALPKSVWRVLRKPVVLILIVDSVVTRLGFTGYQTFEQKYLEVQFNKTPGSVSLSLGAAQLLVLVTGSLLGGCLVSRLKMSRTGMGKFTAIIYVIQACALLGIFFLGCEDQHVLGMPGSEEFSDISIDCECSVENVLPVCGSNGVTYLSPCVAGCLKTDSKVGFVNCTEVDDGLGHVTPGQCNAGCNTYMPFMAAYVGLALMATIPITARIMCITRSVNLEDQPIVLSTSNIVGLLLAGIPAPMVFGKIVDSACTLWAPGGGECQLYSRDQLRKLFIGAYLGLSWGGALLMILAVFFMVRDDRITAVQKKRNEGSSAVYETGARGSDRLELENYQTAMRRASVASTGSVVLSARL